MESTELVAVNARPSAITIDLKRAAVIVVDMQNDFGTEGGMFHRAGFDISSIQAVIDPIARLLDNARRLGVRVVYLKMAFESDLSDIGREGSANRDRHLAWGVGQSVHCADGTTSRVLIRDTWNTDIVDGLTPEPGDTVVYKNRFSGFVNPELDAHLRSFAVTDLIFVGCTTSVCVESTLRDAMMLDYRCLLLEDCTHEPMGSNFSRTNHDASVFIIANGFGWVTSSDELLRDLNQHFALTSDQPEH